MGSHCAELYLVKSHVPRQLRARNSMPRRLHAPYLAGARRGTFRMDLWQLSPKLVPIRSEDHLLCASCSRQLSSAFRGWCTGSARARAARALSTAATHSIWVSPKTTCVIV